MTSKSSAGALDVEGLEGNAPQIATVLVNWRGAEDTLECLESLYSSDYPNQTVIVVDNGSRDGSLEKIVAWAEGRLPVVPKGEMGAALISQACAKPVKVWCGGVGEAVTHASWDRVPDLILIDAGRNHGFAGGVNIGLRCALANAAVKYVWVLNNDTVVARDCLTLLQRRVEEDTSIGMCGCRILYYGSPSVVQVLGGARLNRVLGKSYLLGTRLSASSVVDPRSIERRMDHVSGASMLVSRAFVEIVGLMEEDYFLYFEEADWAERAKRRFRLAYADTAVVYHKEGASIGSSHVRARRSTLSAYFLIRSRVRFMRRFHPWALPFAMAFSLAQTARTFCCGQRDQAKAMLAAIRGITAADAIGWTPE